ncbi:MAG: hypothetical protein NC301_01210 [Bacteroides sp.]|nr:hypothetical protein [Bacteroides sp.]MCM1378770.1 hypothetical protein [Bacteroides sp.]MCM1445387.1 hypothetical protein [Prevotella sp.]
MKRLTRHILASALLCLTAMAARAYDKVYDPAIEFARHQLEGIPVPGGLNEDLVIVHGDTINVILPERNFSRFHRGLFNYLVVPRGQWNFGLTASYGELNTDDIQLLGMLTDVSLKGKTYAVKPSVHYFFRHNQSIGLKVVYTHAEGGINSLGLDIDDDMSFHLSDVEYLSTTYSGAVTYRNYVGLNRSKRFAVFNEVDLSFTSGTSDFTRLYNSEPKRTHTRINEIALNFSPGVSVFIMENVSFNLSFGVFGVKYRKEHQFTNGIDEGTRISSGANFRFNIFNINFGLGVHI